jgi:hypothetical protein
MSSTAQATGAGRRERTAGEPGEPKAIFIAISVYGWERPPPRRHFLDVENRVAARKYDGTQRRRREHGASHPGLFPAED